MPTPFAMLETRMNAAVATHLSNADAVFAAGTVTVDFKLADMDMQAGPGPARQAREWSISAPESDFAAASPARGATATIDGIQYELVGKETDPSGWTTWTVRRK